jgi:hypothetical protein
MNLDIKNSFDIQLFANILGTFFLCDTFVL